MTQVIQKKARLFALFSDPTRLQVIKVLSAKPESSVTSIAHAVKMSVACTSHHLQLLYDNGIISKQRDGNHILYSVKNNQFVNKLISLI